MKRNYKHIGQIKFTKMKYFVPLLVCGIALFFNTNSGYAQCDASKHKQKCISTFTSGFTYKHTFTVDPSMFKGKTEIELPYLLTKNTLYVIEIANSNGEAKNMVVKLYDPNRKLMGTTYDSRSKQFWPIGYACGVSGVHYVKISFINGEKPCGIAVLGQKR